MKKKSEVAVFWFRRDLRIEDNAGLYHALKSGYRVLPVFMFDRDILDKLVDSHDRRVGFIHGAVSKLKKEFKGLESDIFVKYGKINQIWKEIIHEFDVKEVYTNHDYEKYALERDMQAGAMLNENGIPFYTYKDHVLFEKNEVLNNIDKPYSVFTPYSRKWKETVNDFYTRPYPVIPYSGNFIKDHTFSLPSLEEIGFKTQEDVFQDPLLSEQIIRNYGDHRDFPAVNGTTRLSVHLRFGTVSIRRMVQAGLAFNEKWLNELIWRDFYISVLWHFPQINEGKPFKKEYENISWRNNTGEFEKWCLGQTGFPIVDAGMRELNATGFMHNRVRMITASFLCKDLLIDWKWGETYFASKLIDFDFSANNGGWQWAAGCGCDAAPYFRIFNPEAQALKFDKNREYIRKWVPEVDSPSYPQPVTDHRMARERTLIAYKKALGKSY